MKKVVIASKQTHEVEKIRKYTQKYFEVEVLDSPDQIDDKDFHVLLIDNDFTDNSGIDFLMDVIGKRSVPVLMMTPPEDPQCAIEALRAGAFNYIVKSGDYFHFLGIAVNDAIAKYEERAELKQNIKELKGLIQALEQKTGIRVTPKKAAQVPGSTTAGPGRGRERAAVPEKTPEPEPEKEINLLEEIVSRFKRGEVNLPTLPRISTQFNTLIRKGANLREVAAFLRQDVAITTKLINVSNSALYRGIEKNTSLEDAITRLGLGTTRQYVEIIANRSLYTSENKRFSHIVRKLWEHSLACAYAADLTNSLLNSKSDTDLFSLGLTHDIGKLVLIQVIGEIGTRNETIEKIEQEKLLKTLDLYHGRFGAVLLKRWKFPQIFGDVAMYHDHITKVDDPSHEFLCVHFANRLVNAEGYGIKKALPADLTQSKSFQLLRLRTDEITIVQEKTGAYMSEIKTVL